MNKEDVRQKMLDIVGDIYNADSADYINNGFDNFDGHTWYEANDTINKAFDRLEPDHPKVKLPLEVGEDFDKAVAYLKNKYNSEDVFDVLATNLSKQKGGDYHSRLNAWYVFADDALTILADAYRYGWKAEPEAKWYVKAPESWKADGGWLNWLYKPSRSGVDMCGHTGESDEQFTRAELKHYHLDSDIFTLVPVEDEK